MQAHTRALSDNQGAARFEIKKMATPGKRLWDLCRESHVEKSTWNDSCNYQFFLQKNKLDWWKVMGLPCIYADSCSVSSGMGALALRTWGDDMVLLPAQLTSMVQPPKQVQNGDHLYPLHRRSGCLHRRPAEINQL
jgi:hypothetical protein